MQNSVNWGLMENVTHNSSSLSKPHREAHVIRGHGRSTPLRASRDEVPPPDARSIVSRSAVLARCTSCLIAAALRPLSAAASRSVNPSMRVRSNARRCAVGNRTKHRVQVNPSKRSGVRPARRSNPCRRGSLRRRRTTDCTPRQGRTRRRLSPSVARGRCSRLRSSSRTSTLG